jgi:hypothetical protein
MLRYVLSAATGMALFVGHAAFATTINSQAFSSGAYAAAVGPGAQVFEGFEGFGLPEGEVGTNFNTAVGTFNTIGGTGSGGTVTGLSGNTGTELALRDGNTFGRTNTTPGGRWYLDSNDTKGMLWDVNIGTMFERIVFVLTDGSDVGGWLSVIADGVRYEQRTAGQLGNGNRQIVTIDFGSAVSSAQIALGVFSGSGSTSYRLNDGFSIDDISVAPVPVPATLPLLLAGLGGIAFLRRRQRSTASA